MKQHLMHSCPGIGDQSEPQELVEDLAVGAKLMVIELQYLMPYLRMREILYPNPSYKDNLLLQDIQYVS